MKLHVVHVVQTQVLETRLHVFPQKFRAMEGIPKLAVEGSAVPCVLLLVVDESTIQASFLSFWFRFLVCVGFNPRAIMGDHQRVITNPTVGNVAHLLS